MPCADAGRGTAPEAPDPTAAGATPPVRHLRRLNRMPAAPSLDISLADTHSLSQEPEMKPLIAGLIAGLAACLAVLPRAPALAFDTVLGSETRYQSYNGVAERCVQIAPVPGGAYDKGDLRDETRLCGIDFYDEAVALCPKIWSTSLAIVAYDISEGPMKGQRTRFQEEVCPTGKLAKEFAKDDLARLKTTMNHDGTSATHSAAALLYYHFSRALGLTTRVPAAVWRSVDKDVMLNEVALGGLEASTYDTRLAKNHAAWQALIVTIRDPGSYDDAFYGTSADILTADGTQVYGVFYKGSGDVYGPVINAGGDAGADGAGYAGFRKVPPMVALATPAPLAEAIARGLAEGTDDPTQPEDTAANIPARQMAFWMRELSEVLLIDFMLGQQDRLSNIEYVPYWYWLKDGKAERVRTKDGKPGEGEVPADAVLIRRTRLNDNDAAGRPQYDNWTRKLGLLEDLRHFDAGVYRRLMAMAADFRADGPMRVWLTESFGLAPEQAAMIVDNTLAAAAILRATCERGELAFDLDPEAFFETGAASPVQQACDGS